MYQQTHQKIHHWYRTHGRLDLPWRNTHNPYHIYISEIMLQQTQVKTVLERFYFPFLEKFPTLKALGDAPLDEVLKMWEGLGYYTRAKNLHFTAQSIEKLPSEIESLIKLKGIGKNTAHALASFAFGQPVPIMEANVKRILCRLYRLTSPVERELWDLAYTLVDKENPYDYNQAMMDIGSTLCLPKNPHCQICPLERLCQGKDQPTLYPLKKKKIVPTREANLIVYLYDDKISLLQRRGKFLHGLWGFESVVTPPCESEYLGVVTQTYTHFKFIAHVYLSYQTSASSRDYFTCQEIETLALSSVDKKIIQLIEVC